MKVQLNLTHRPHLTACFLFDRIFMKKQFEDRHLTGKRVITNFYLKKYIINERHSAFVIERRALDKLFARRRNTRFRVKRIVLQRCKTKESAHIA